MNALLCKNHNIGILGGACWPKLWVKALNLLKCSEFPEKIEVHGILVFTYGLNMVVISS